MADIETFRQEALRPDGTMEVSPGALAKRQIEFRTRDDLATAHFQLLQEAKNAIDVKGPNAIEMGDGAAGAIPPSGRAILASQQGGMIQVGDLFDNLRHLDKRVFRCVWARVRQFWTAEKWVRVTDDERNVRWLGLNLDPYAMAQLRMRAQEFPQEAQASLAGSGRAACRARLRHHHRRGAGLAHAADRAIPEPGRAEEVRRSRRDPVPRHRPRDAEPEGQADVPEGHGGAGGSGRRRLRKGRNRTRDCASCNCAARRPKSPRRRARQR